MSKGGITGYINRIAHQREECIIRGESVSEGRMHQRKACIIRGVDA